MIEFFGSHAFAAMLQDVTIRQSAVVAIAMSAALLLRRRSAAHRHAVWAAAVVATLAIAALAAAPRWVLPVLPATAPAASSAQPSAVVHADAGVRERTPTPARPIPWDAIAVGLWALGVLVMAARLARSHALLGRILRGATAIGDADARAECADAARTIGLRRRVALLATDEVAVPLACGLFTPVVLVPSARMSRGRWRAVLVHELAHHRRGDVAWALLGEVARVLCWFHPLVHLAVRRMRAESEFASDDAALAAGESPSGLADALVALAPRARALEPLAVGMAGSSSVVARVEALLGRRDRRGVGRAGGLAVATLAGAVIVLAGVATPGTATSSSRAPSRTLAEARVKDLPDAPVRLLGAVVEARSSGRGEVTLTKLRMGLASREPRRTIEAVLLELRTSNSIDRFWARVAVPPLEGGRLRIPEEGWSNSVRSDRAELVVSIAAVRYTNGTTWPERLPSEDDVALAPTAKPSPTPRATPAPPPARDAIPDRAPTPAPSPTRDGSVTPHAAPPPPPVRTDEDPDAGPFVPPPGTVMLPVRVRNFPGAPAQIVEAHTRQLGGAGAEENLAAIPTITVRNDGRRPIVAMRVRYKAGTDAHAVSGFHVLIRPGQTGTVGDMARLMDGRPEKMTVQLLGVRFDDGSVWGTMDSTIDTRDEWIDPEGTHR